MSQQGHTAATLDPSAVREPIEDRASQRVGAVISDRYRIEQVLGSGGMGAVYLVQHTHMRKRYALKMLHAETAKMPEVVARFEREAVAMANADHPNIAQATDFGRAQNGAFFLVLEYLEGYRLRDAMATGPLDVRRAVHIVKQIGSALERANELGIIHRDLKPENIMLVPKHGDYDFVKILDFGLAKLAPDSMDQEGEGQGQMITRHGSVFGTPRYMAPEQCVGESVDGRTDLYSLGLIFYEMLAGAHPYEERDPRKVIKHQLFTPIPPLKSQRACAELPASLEALVMKLTQKVPSQRFQNAKEMLAALAEVCEREGITPPDHTVRPPTPAAGIGIQRVAPDAHPSDAMATQDAVPDDNATQDAISNDNANVTAAAIPASEATTEKPIEKAAITVPKAVPVVSVPKEMPKLSPLAQLLQKLPEPLRKQPLLLAPVGLVVLVLLFLILRPGSKPKTGQPAPTAGTELSASKPTSGPITPTAAPALPSQLEHATAAGKKDALLELLKQHPTDPKISKALAHAYVSEGNGVEGLRWLAKALALSETSVYDGEIMQAATLALRAPDSAESAITMLERDFGSRGVDVLYALLVNAGPGRNKIRLLQSVAKPEVRAHATPATLIAIDLHAATKCEAKRALLSRAGQDGDQRTLQLLRPLTVNRGCGSLNMNDCWPCMRKDASLRNAIAAITARASLAH